MATKPLAVGGSALTAQDQADVREQIGAVALTTAQTTAGATGVAGLSADSQTINNAGVSHVRVGPNPSNSDDEAILIARSVNNAGSGNGHAFSDSSVITRSGDVAYNSFDARVIFSGSAPYNHYAAFQAGFVYNSTGTLTNLFDFISAPTVSAGSVTERYAFYAANVIETGAGSVVSQHAFFVPSNFSAGSLYNYAFNNQSDARCWTAGPFAAKQLFLSDADGTPTAGFRAHLNTGDGIACLQRFQQQGQNFWDFGIPASSIDFAIYSLNTERFRFTNSALFGRQLKTVASLPAASTALKGYEATVEDALSPSWGVALVGGGSVVCGARCSGTAWVAF